jgi:predicted TIM-barrel enzyme
VFRTRIEDLVHDASCRDRVSFVDIERHTHRHQWAEVARITHDGICDARATERYPERSVIFVGVSALADVKYKAVQQPLTVSVLAEPAVRSIARRDGATPTALLCRECSERHDEPIKVASAQIAG